MNGNPAEMQTSPGSYSDEQTSRPTELRPGDEALLPEDKNGLDAFTDALEIIRLVQCSICSFPLRHPLALPCGNVLCRNCLPKTYARQGISFPDTPVRREGFMCPFEDCEKEHAVADCGTDFALAKVVGIVEHNLGGDSPPGITQPGPDDSQTRDSRLVTVYKLGKAGQLPYDGEFTFAAEEDGGTDTKVLRVIRDAICSEMECQVCYGLMFDPVTAYCGHTFCRRCLRRVMDHSQLCPSCRQRLQLPTASPGKSTNKRLTDILRSICSDALAQRAIAIAIDDNTESEDESLTLPIFVCTCSFPGMPTPLFIFEPRYRLMIRRAWDSDQLFGMVLPNKGDEPQGELGRVPFVQYGTTLRIEHVQVYPDGRSHIWTVGVSKFKIKRWGLRDDYIVAETERIDDIPLAEEEALEALETTNINPSSEFASLYTQLSTQELLETCREFVDRMQALSAPWMQETNLIPFGPQPDHPATFPYWLASVLPLADQEKYKLIKSTSVRDRLIIVATWVKRIENQQW
jgi:Lon protease-like protein